MYIILYILLYSMEKTNYFCWLLVLASHSFVPVYTVPPVGVISESSRALRNMASLMALVMGSMVHFELPTTEGAPDFILWIRSNYNWDYK